MCLVSFERELNFLPDKITFNVFYAGYHDNFKQKPIFCAFSPKLKITKFCIFRIAEYFCGIDFKLSRIFFKYNIDIV